MRVNRHSPREQMGKENVTENGLQDKAQVKGGGTWGGPSTAKVLAQKPQRGGESSHKKRIKKSAHRTRGIKKTSIRGAHVAKGGGGTPHVKVMRDGGGGGCAGGVRGVGSTTSQLD